MVNVRWGTDNATGMPLVSFHNLDLRLSGADAAVGSIKGVFRALGNSVGMLIVVFEKKANIHNTMQAVVDTLGQLGYFGESFTDERSGATWKRS